MLQSSYNQNVMNLLRYTENQMIHPLATPFASAMSDPDISNFAMFNEGGLTKESFTREGGAADRTQRLSRILNPIETTFQAGEDAAAQTMRCRSACAPWIGPGRLSAPSNRGPRL